MAEKLLTGFCPNCYCKLDYDAKDIYDEQKA